MAKFLKIEKSGIYLNLEKVECVNVAERKVFVIGGGDYAYSCFSDKDWENIMAYINHNPAIL